MKSPRRSSNEEVLELFKYRCIRCQRQTKIVHEIEIFRSGGEKAYELGNRAPLCIRCHEWAHSGNTREKRKILMKLRSEALERYG